MIKVNETLFRHVYADGNCLWRVTEKRGRGTWIATIEPNDSDYAGTQGAFTTQQIESAIRASEFWSKSSNDSERFFNNLPVGSIVHYKSGEGAVRCKMTSDHQLLPIAMVGKWLSMDLPHRYNNGNIELNYHARQIKERKTFQPHASNVYEYQHRPTDIDPRNMAPINLELPPMTPAEQALADKYRKVEQLQSIVNQNIPPDYIFFQLKRFLDSTAL